MRVALIIVAAASFAGAPPLGGDVGSAPTDLLHGNLETVWQGDLSGWTLLGGVLSAGVDALQISTRDSFGDFILRLEFQLTPGANNGIGIRAPLGSNPAYDGMEIQILDHDHQQYNELKPWQAHGSVYGVIPAIRALLKPAPEWNTEEIIADGTHIRVTVNGLVVVDADLTNAARGGTIDGRPHPGLLNERGPISLLGHGDAISFRNIQVRTLH